jgi:formylglycine-generating enzyme required for sulfatase activity
VTNTKHPVTKITWFDAVVWCNALTEYYNDAYHPAVPLTPVYYYDAAYANVARHSAPNAFPQEPSRSHEDGGQVYRSQTAFPKAGTTGFRLPSLDEWEFAYRYEGSQKRSTTALWANSIYFSHSDSASGAVSQSEFDVRYVAYFGATGTSPVGMGRAPNKLNIYDMSGNVQEWTDSWTYGTVDSRVTMGTDYTRSLANTTLRIGYNYRTPATMDEWRGFRVARSN